LKRKSDVFNKFIEWKNLVEKSTGKQLKTLRSDNGGEYTSKEFENYFKHEGIRHEFTVPKTPEQNGVAERMNRTLEECVRSMLCESNLPKRFWGEALSTATYLRNRSPTNAVSGITPYEAWTGDKPIVEHLKVFGCICYAHIPKDERKKLDSKAKEAILVGYGTNVKGYRLYDQTSQKIFYSRDVLFNEFKFSGMVKQEGTPKIEVSQNNDIEIEADINNLPVEIDQPDEQNDTINENIELQDENIEENVK